MHAWNSPKHFIVIKSGTDEAQWLTAWMFYSEIPEFDKNDLHGMNCGAQWTYSLTNDENANRTIRFSDFCVLQFNQRRRTTTTKQSIQENLNLIKKQWSWCHFHLGIFPSPFLSSSGRAEVAMKCPQPHIAANREHWALWSSSKSSSSGGQAIFW